MGRTERSPGGRHLAAALAVVALGLTASGAAGASDARSTPAPATPGTYTAFSDPQPVTIEGLTGSAMEPFISPDGKDLLFNTSNVAPDIPALQYATLTPAGTFTDRGAIVGANKTGVLSGTPALDQQGTLYWISTRSYSRTLSTVYSGHFASGAVTGVQRVAGVTASGPGVVDFDVGVSADGAALYVSVGHFDGGPPTGAHLVLYDRAGAGFVADPDSAALLRAVNQTATLTYAAAVSSNGRELFFTGADPSSGTPAIYRAVRDSPSDAFGHVQRLGAITGFAEAPSISTDGTTLYYHLLVGSTYQIWTVTRPR
jgi:Tol biopolymer transport system component